MIGLTGKSYRASFYKGTGVMLRLRIAELIALKGWTRYRFAKEAGLTFDQAYRIARADGRFNRLDRTTIEKACRALGIKPGDLFRD